MAIGPDPLLWNTAVSPKIHRSVPLGRETLTPSSRDTHREEFSYVERTGGAEGDAIAREDVVTTPTSDEMATRRPRTSVPPTRYRGRWWSGPCPPPRTASAARSRLLALRQGRRVCAATWFPPRPSPHPERANEHVSICLDMWRAPSGVSSECNTGNSPVSERTGIGPGRTEVERHIGAASARRYRAMSMRQERRQHTVSIPSAGGTTHRGGAGGEPLALEARAQQLPPDVEGDAQRRLEQVAALLPASAAR